MSIHMKSFGTSDSVLFQRVLDKAESAGGSFRRLSPEELEAFFEQILVLAKKHIEQSERRPRSEEADVREFGYL
jgi:hypothetical protein